MNKEEKLKKFAYNSLKFYGLCWLFACVHMYVKSGKEIETGIVLYILIVYVYALLAFLIGFATYETRKTLYDIDNSTPRFLNTMKNIILIVLSAFLHFMATVLAFYKVIL